MRAEKVGAQRRLDEHRRDCAASGPRARSRPSRAPSRSALALPSPRYRGRTFLGSKRATNSWSRARAASGWRSKRFVERRAARRSTDLERQVAIGSKQIDLAPAEARLDDQTVEGVALGAAGMDLEHRGHHQRPHPSTSSRFASPVLHEEAHEHDPLIALSERDGILGEDPQTEVLEQRQEIREHDAFASQVELEKREAVRVGAKRVAEIDADRAGFTRAPRCVGCRSPPSPRRSPPCTRA